MQIQLAQLILVYLKLSKQINLMSFHLMAYNNKYVSCTISEKTQLCCHIDVAKGWETFEYNILDSSRIQIKCVSNSKYLCAEKGGGEKVYGNRNAALEWETFTYGMLKGVNLKGWFIPTKSLNPEFYRDYDQTDLFSLCSFLGKDVTIRKFNHHYLNFIKKDDFLWMAFQGINTVRLPIAFWNFMEDSKYHTYPFTSYEYIEDCFNWAETYGISILLDIQAPVGSQNGKSESGKIGDADFDLLETISFVKTICKLIGKKKNLLGINLLHQPDIKLIGQYYIHKIHKSGLENNSNIIDIEVETFKILFNKFFMKDSISSDPDRENVCEYLGRSVLSKYYKQAYENIISYFPNIMVTIINNSNMQKIKESNNLVLDIYLKPFIDEENKTFQQLLDQVDKITTEICLLERKVILGEFSCTLPNRLYKENSSEIYNLTSELYRRQREAAKHCFAFYFYTYKSEYEILSLKNFLEKGYIDKF
jgi:hypothetical protein